MYQKTKNITLELSWFRILKNIADNLFEFEQNKIISTLNEALNLSASFKELSWVTQDNSQFSFISLKFRVWKWWMSTISNIIDKNLQVFQFKSLLKC